MNEELPPIDWRMLQIIYLTGCDYWYWHGIMLPWTILLPSPGGSE